jgi:CRP/FNR family transcriptional regulator, dissimilatory nitrate respiration regulator
MGREPIAETPSLQDVALFARLDDPTLHRLSIDAKIETFDDSAAIFRQGDPVTAYYVIVHGFVKILRIAPSGDETLITIRSDGDSLDAPPGLQGDDHRVSAEALGAVCALKLPAARFARAMQESPPLADAMMRDAKAKIAVLVGEIESLKSQNADQRLARFILSLCAPGVDQCRFRLPYDKRHLAAQLGVTQETLSRAFAKLRDLGVRTETRAVTVESVARLAAQCNDSA